VKCNRCQSDNRDGARFCESCGTRLLFPCVRCGAAAVTDQKFCGACGAALPGAAFETSASPDNYTPPYLAEKILGAREHLEGERKQVTILFADVRGSLEMLADRDPEDARSVLDPILTEMMEAVHAYEGTVNQVMGDGIMALFGAPLAHEDHAVRACYAALRMQERIAAVAEELRQRDGISVLIRVGVNSGEVVVRSIGSDLRMDYTAVGQTAHLAGRMEQLAHPGQTFITEQTLRLADGFVVVKSLGLVPIKGLAEPVPVFELTGVGEVRSRLQLSAARGLTRFVGRELELAELRVAMEQAAQARGQVIALVGEPGVGKSRLVREFTTGLGSQWRVLSSFATPFDTREAYLPVVGLLRGYFDIDYPDERRIREKVISRLLSLGESFAAMLPALLAILDVPVEDSSWQALEPRQRRSRMLEAIRRLLLGESQRTPLCLVVEDLHWMAPEAQAALDAIVESLPAARILLLATYRPGYEHSWNRKSYYAQVAVRPLPESIADELLRELLGDGADVNVLRRQLVERAEGNPFFIEESVRHLVDTGVLAGERGRYRLVRRDAPSDVPATIQALLAERIDRLLPVDKAVLQCASVIGKDVPVALLESIAGLGPDELRRSLAHLQAAEFVYETSLFPAHQYTFKHALTLDVAYSSLLHGRRRALHGHIVQALETLFADRLVEHVERLAHHAFRGEVWPKAVEYLRQAGARAATRSFNREAIARFQEALVALGHLAETRETVEQAIDIRLEMRHSLLLVGDHGQIFESLRQAGELASRLDDRLRFGWVSSYLAHYWWYVGDPDLAIEAGQRALDIADTVDDPVLRVLTDFHVGQAHHSLGQYRRAIDFFSRTVTSAASEVLAERFGALYAVRSRSWLAWCFAELGQFGEGRLYGEAGVNIAETVDQPFSLITAYVGVGVVHLRKGEIPAAIRVLERALALCHARDLPVLFPTVASRLGAAYALHGRTDEALPLLKRAAAEAASMSRLSGHSLRLIHLGEAYLDAGRVEDALAAARRGLELARQHKEGAYEAWALRLLGDASARLAAPEWEQADAAFTQSLALATGLDMRPLIAHCHAGLSRSRRQLGKRVDAEEHARVAAAMFEELDMPFWRHRAEAGSGGASRG
jgi:class 3 adenylate cyclase/tetratricopeptide (TPR) repeat protein